LSDDSTARSARGLYGISVTSELSGIAPQTLRLYERRGLLAPSRTGGGTRRYSDEDLQRLQRITELVDQGVNLAGIAHILDLETENSQLLSDYTQLELRHAQLKVSRQAAAGGRRDREHREHRREGCRS
jgi:DNA-binding transcriptional MerR regulator